jgi:small subunit ribosomal protein S12
MISNGQLNSKTRSRINIPNKLRCPALIGGPYRKSVVEKIFIRNPKKPNSAKRKVCKAVVRMTKRRVDTYIPGIGHSLQKFSQILIRGGRCQDVPGVRYTAVKGIEDFRYKENFERMRRRSIYGIPKMKRNF